MRGSGDESEYGDDRPGQHSRLGMQQRGDHCAPSIESILVATLAIDATRRETRNSNRRSPRQKEEAHQSEDSRGDYRDRDAPHYFPSQPTALQSSRWLHFPSSVFPVLVLRPPHAVASFTPCGIYSEGRDEDRFNRWCALVASLPHPKTRVLTWPIVTVF